MTKYPRNKRKSTLRRKKIIVPVYSSRKEERKNPPTPLKYKQVVWQEDGGEKYCTVPTILFDFLLAVPNTQSAKKCKRNGNNESVFVHIHTDGGVRYTVTTPAVLTYQDMDVLMYICDVYFCQNSAKSYYRTRTYNARYNMEVTSHIARVAPGMVKTFLNREIKTDDIRSALIR